MAKKTAQVGGAKPKEIKSNSCFVKRNKTKNRTKQNEEQKNVIK